MPTVLVVEDELLIALDLAASIEELGCEIVGVARTGAEARRVAETARPDLVLMDVTIAGDCDGVEAARAIRAIAPAKLIFLTALTDQDTRCRAAAMQPEAFLTKPCPNGELRRAVASALGMNTH